jgi:membrane-associated protease RseP (regulator of RpoE activity)
MARIPVLAALSIAFLACATTPHLYQSWDDQLTSMVHSLYHEGTLHSKQDVSLLLGSPPSQCEKVESGTRKIGIFVPVETPTVGSVVPGTPAARAGVRPGDVITAVDGIAGETSAETLKLVGHALQSKESVRLTTNRGEFEVASFVPMLEQCYWDVSSGRVSTSSASLYMNTYAGTGNANSAGYDRFYRTTCRFYEGWLVDYRSNWQM